MSTTIRSRSQPPVSPRFRAAFTLMAPAVTFPMTFILLVWFCTNMKWVKMEGLIIGDPVHVASVCCVVAGISAIVVTGLIWRKLGHRPLRPWDTWS